MAQKKKQKPFTWESALNNPKWVIGLIIAFMAIFLPSTLGWLLQRAFTYAFQPILGIAFIGLFLTWAWSKK